MATERVIGTKFKVDGEADIKAAVKDLNADLGLLRSEMKMVESEFKGNANSLDALTAKYKVLGKQIDTQEKKLSKYQEGLSKAQKAEKEFGDKVQDLKKKIEEKEKALDKLQKSTGDTTKEEEKLKKELTELNSTLEKTETKQTEAANTVRDYQKSVNLTQAEINKLGHAEKELAGYMDEAKSSVDGNATSIDENGKKVKKAGEDFEDFGSKSGQAVEALAGALVAAGINEKIDVITEALMECSQKAAEFETAIAKVSTLTDPTAASTDDLAESYMNLSNEMGRSASGLAEAGYQALSAGVDTANAVEFVDQATQLAIGGFTDSSTAVDILTTILNAYKLEASETAAVSDMLVATQNLGKTSVAELAANMGRAIPTAAGYGVAIDQLSTGYVMLTKNGINTRIATTNLSSMFDELGKSGSTVADILVSQTGKSFAELMEDGYSLGDVLDILTDSVSGNSTEFKNLWSSTTAADAAMTIFNSGAGAFNSTLEEVRNSAGATAENYQKMADTTEFAQEKMENSINNLQIAIGSVLNPSLKEMYNIGSTAFDWATEFVNEHPEVVAAVQALVIVLKVLVSATVGIIAVSDAVLALKKALKVLDIALSASKVGMIVAAAAAATIAITAFINTTNNANNEVKDFNKSIEESADRYDQLKAEAEESGATFETLAAKLNYLSETSDGSDASLQAIQDVMQELIALVPELADVFDLETGAMEDNWEAVAANAQQKQAYTDALKREAEIYGELAEAQAKGKKTQEDLKAAESKGIGLLDIMATANDSYTGSLDGRSESTSGLIQKVLGWANAEEKLKGDLEDVQEEIEGYKEAEEEVADATDEATAAISAQATALETTTDKLEEVADKYGMTAEAVAEAAAAAGMSLDEWTKAQEDLAAKAKSSYDEITGATQNFSKVTQLSYENATDSIRSYKEATATYNQNIAALTEMGATEVIEWYERTGMSGNDMVTGLINDAGRMSEFRELLADSAVEAGHSFEEGLQPMPDSANSAIDEAGAAIEGNDAIETAVEGNVDNAIDAANEKAPEFEQSGQEAGDNYASGVKSKSSTAQGAGKTVADGAVSGAKTAIPGFESAGDNAVRGFINRINSGALQAYAAGRAFGQKAVDGVNAGIDAHSPSKETEKAADNYSNGFIFKLKTYEAAAFTAGAAYGRAAALGLTSAVTDSSTFNFVGTAIGAEAAAEEFKNRKAELDHLKAMDVIDEAEYYSQLLALRNEYLLDIENLDTWRSVTESIYKYEQSLIKSQEDIYSELLDDLEYYYKMGLISTEEYWENRRKLMDMFLEEDSPLYRKAQEDLLNADQSIYGERLADLEHYYKMGLISTEEYWLRRKELMETYLDSESEAYRKAQEEFLSAGNSIYSEKLADLDFYLALGIITEAEYYSELTKLRDTYLEEDSDAWRSATLKMFNYRKSALEDALKKEKQLIADQLQFRKQALDDYLKERKTQIQEELEAEKERVNEIISGIRDEMAARKQAKEDTDYEAAIAAAEKRRDALIAQIEYARDEENKKQLEDELIRAEEDLDRAKQAYEDAKWEREQLETISEWEEYLKQQETDAKEQITQLEDQVELEKELLEKNAEILEKVAERKYDLQFNMLEKKMDELIKEVQAAAEARREAEASAGGVGGSGGAGAAYYDKNVDYSSLMLGSKSEMEFQEWARRREIKMEAEGIDSGSVASREDLYEQWKSSNQAQDTVARTAAMTAAAVTQSIQNINNNNQSAKLVVNSNSAPTTGQMEAMLDRLIERNSR